LVFTIMFKLSKRSSIGWNKKKNRQEAELNKIKTNAQNLRTHTIESLFSSLFMVSNSHHKVAIYWSNIKFSFHQKQLQVFITNSHQAIKYSSKQKVIKQYYRKF